MARDLVSVLLAEKAGKISGGVYNKLQVDFAYNSNHIEGSKLTHDQTRYIYETQTVGIEPARVDDIIEAVNHFRCFDKVIATYKDKITPDYIKSLHFTLKSSTLSSEREEAVVGDYKKFPKYVGDMKTASPETVKASVDALLRDYNMIESVDLYDILAFHAEFEKRCRRVMERDDLPEKQALDAVMKNDKQRMSYYNYYTNNRWGDANNYNLTLDSGLTGVDGAIDVIKSFIEITEKNR